jgi:RNA polymerase sigma factor (sigma-70 family)
MVVRWCPFAVTLFAEHPGLLLPFRRGDRAALETVYRRYATGVLRMLRNGFAIQSVRVPGVTDPEALLDCVQDVFLRAFGASGRVAYDPARPYRPYLFRIAKNLRIDQLRRSGREVPLLPDAGDDADDVILEPEMISVQDPEAQDLKARVRRYVGGLDEEQKTFVELRFCDELSQEEVAIRMNITRRRTRTLETNVLAGLRGWLGEETT